MKIPKYLLVVFLITTLSACDVFTGPPIKPGYTAVSLGDQEKMAALDTALKTAKIDHYSFRDRSEHKLFIAYPKTEEQKVRDLINEVYGSHHPYKDTKALCFHTKQEQDSMLKSLAGKDIAYTPGKDNALYCVYWPEQDDKKVENAFLDYKHMKDACRAAPECRKTMSTESGTGYRQQ